MSEPLSSEHSRGPLARLGRLVERRLSTLWLPYFALTALGLVLFSSADPAITTPAFMAPDRPDEQLPLLSRGATLEVSSYDWFRSHHPLFAIDGEARPEGWQMWATDKNDRAPFVEVRLPEPTDIGRVALDFVGLGNWPENALPTYTIACRRGDTPVARLAVEGNVAQKPSHTIGCEGVDRVRIEFALGDLGQPFSIVRLYELELSPPESAP